MKFVFLVIMVIINTLVLLLLIEEAFSSRSPDKIIGMTMLILGNFVLYIAIKPYEKNNYVLFIICSSVALIFIGGSTCIYWKLINALN